MKNQKPTPRLVVNQPRATAGELAALNDTLNLMNSQIGAEVPPGENVKAPVNVPTAVIPPPAEVEIPPGLTVEKDAALDEIPPLQPVTTKRIFFTGQLAAGKDYCAAAINAKTLGFADPLYAIATAFFGFEVSSTKNKGVPGMRAFLQTIGQWGRRVISEKYPVTPARALLCQEIRRRGVAGDFGFGEVDWESFGRGENIWVDAGIKRAEKSFAPIVAITNCRFDNEVKALREAGFSHWHVMCHSTTWAKRLAALKLTVDAPQVKDLSEQLAIRIQQHIVKQVSAQKSGGKMNVIWSDDFVPPPSPRFFTIKEFAAKMVG